MVEPNRLAKSAPCATRVPSCREVVSAGVGFLYPDSGQAAARWYSWMSPPSRSWRSIGPVRGRGGGSGAWRPSAVGPLVVVVLEVLAQDALEVALVADQEPVEALGADGADEALGVGVRDGRADRRLDDADPFAREHGVEGGGELAVAVSDQEPERGESRVQGEVAGLLGNPGAGRVLSPRPAPRPSQLRSAKRVKRDDDDPTGRPVMSCCGYVSDTPRGWEQASSPLTLAAVGAETAEPRSARPAPPRRCAVCARRVDMRPVL